VVDVRCRGEVGAGVEVARAVRVHGVVAADHVGTPVRRLSLVPPSKMQLMPREYL
jgi:hypothetical protein